MTKVENDANGSSPTIPPKGILIDGWKSRYQNGGFTDEQAATLADEKWEFYIFIMQNVATKPDLNALQANLEKSMVTTKSELSEKMLRNGILNSGAVVLLIGLLGFVSKITG